MSVLVTVHVQGPGHYDEPTDKTLTFVAESMKVVEAVLGQAGWTSESEQTVTDHLTDERIERHVQ